MEAHRSPIGRAAIVGLAASAMLLIGAAAMLIGRRGSGPDWAVVNSVVAHRGGAWVAVARAVTEAGVLWLLLLAGCATAVMLWRVAGVRAAVVPVVSLLVGSAAAQLLKQWFGRVRPPMVLREAPAAGWAFPSGHATNAAAFFAAVSIVLVARVTRSRAQRLAVLLLASLVVLLVGASRVVLGVHWPSDVLAGWALGTGVASLCAWGVLRPAAVDPTVVDPAVVDPAA